MLTDSHVHFDPFAAAGEIPAILERAALAGVARMVAIGGSAAANELALRLAREYPDRIRSVIGFDRDLAVQSLDWSALRKQLEAGGASGIGEAGLDYHYEPHTAAEQRRLFAAQLQLAVEFGLPIVIHSRDADEDMHALLADHVKNWKGDPLRVGVLHCFTGSLIFARRLLDLGFYISFSGIITFKNAADLREVVRHVPLERLLVETDAPYLAPVPHRGKRNEPAFVTEVARLVAELKNQPREEIERQTGENTLQLFGWKS